MVTVMAVCPACGWDGTVATRGRLRGSSFWPACMPGNPHPHHMCSPCALPLLLALSPRAVPQVMYCGLLTTDLALLLEVLALQNVSSVDAAIIYTLEPVTGAGLAWLVLGERLGPLGLAGAGIILASSVASQLLGGEPAPPAVAAALASASDVEGSVDAELLPAKPKSKKSE